MCYAQSTHDIAKHPMRLTVPYIDMIHLRRVLLGLVATLVVATPVRAQSTNALERSFRTPPDAAKPRVWWHWMNGNVTDFRPFTKDSPLLESGLLGPVKVNVVQRAERE